MMKTLQDLYAMDNEGNTHEQFFNMLESYFKSNVPDRIMNELEKWDEPSKSAIIEILMYRILKWNPLDQHQ